MPVEQLEKELTVDFLHFKAVSTFGIMSGLVLIDVLYQTNQTGYQQQLAGKWAGSGGQGVLGPGPNKR